MAAAHHGACILSDRGRACGCLPLQAGNTALLAWRPARMASARARASMHLRTCMGCMHACASPAGSSESRPARPLARRAQRPTRPRPPRTPRAPARRRSLPRPRPVRCNRCGACSSKHPARRQGAHHSPGRERACACGRNTVLPAAGSGQRCALPSTRCACSHWPAPARHASSQLDWFMGALRARRKAAPSQHLRVLKQPDPFMKA